MNEKAFISIFIFRAIKYMETKDASTDPFGKVGIIVWMVSPDMECNVSAIS
jgi:hypothetical protein